MGHTVIEMSNVCIWWAIDTSNYYFLVTSGQSYFNKYGLNILVSCFELKVVSLTEVAVSMHKQGDTTTSPALPIIVDCSIIWQVI